MNKHDTKDLKAALRGQWLEVLRDLGNGTLSSAAQDFKKGKQVQNGFACPVHGGKSNEAFRLLKDADMTGGCACNSCGVQTDGFSTLMFANGWDFKTTKKELINWLWGAEPTEADKAELKKLQAQRAKAIAAQEAQQKKEDELKSNKLIERYSQIWSESVALSDASAVPAKLYFKSRGIENMINSVGHVRYHPCLPYYENKELIGYFPCLVSIVSEPSGKVKNLHQTFLTQDGFKADLKHAKKLAVSIPVRNETGGAIRLMDASTSDTLAVGEGIETSLSWAALFGGNVWSCVNASMLSNFMPPSGIRTVIAITDNDYPDHRGQRAGMNAALKLRERLAHFGIEVKISLAPKEGTDWNDELMQLSHNPEPVQEPAIDEICYDYSDSISQEEVELSFYYDDSAITQETLSPPTADLWLEGMKDAKPSPEKAKKIASTATKTSKVVGKIALALGNIALDVICNSSKR